MNLDRRVVSRADVAWPEAWMESPGAIPKRVTIIIRALFWQSSSKAKLTQANLT